MTCHVAICDDEPADARYVESIVRRWAASRHIDAVMETFSAAEPLLSRFEDRADLDILLLDIEMGNAAGAGGAVGAAGAMDGVALAKAIRRLSKTVQIVFITGYSDYFADGYDVEALHYLIKPVDGNKLADVLDRAVARQRRKLRCLNLVVAGETIRIPLYAIRYLSVKRNYVTVHADRDYTVKRSLGDFEPELGDTFLRVGRALIINLEYVRRATTTTVRLADGTELPLPRGAYEPLNRAIIERT